MFFRFPGPSEASFYEFTFGRRPKERWAAVVCQVLIGRFETAYMPRIPLVAEFGTDHIEKALFVVSASIFSDNIGGMKLKFGEEIEKNLID